MPESYRVIEVVTPVGAFQKRTAQPAAVVSVYRATRAFLRAGTKVKPGELFAVWHRTHKAAADAPRLLFSARMIGQCFVGEREWIAAQDH